MRKFTFRWLLSLLVITGMAFTTNAQVIFEDDFETDNGWTLGGEFERAAPQGLGGEHGNPDPTAAFGGTNVLGTDLTGLGSNSGDYEANLGDRADYAISPVIDCSAEATVVLEFQQYLNVESPSYDHAYIDITTDGGTTWTQIWTNSASVTDNDWNLQTFDITAEAAGQAAVQIRFANGATDVSWFYSGWNIDDFKLRNQSTETDITAFSFPTETTPATIDASAHTVDIEVSASTDLTTLVATFTLSSGAAADIAGTAQVSGTTSNDFSSAVTYTITAEDGTTTQDWTVNVTQATVSAENDILTFSFPEETGAATIDASAHTVNIEVAWTADITNLTADFTLSLGAAADIAGTAQVSGTTANDFTAAVTYTITAEDGTTTQDWTITVTQEPVPQGARCSDPLPLTLPVANETGNTAGFGDDYDNTMACNSSYMGGDDIVYEFTVATPVLLSGDITSSQTYIGMHILDGCPDAGANCIVTATSGSSSSASFTDQYIAAGTYLLILSSWPAPQSFDFEFNLTTAPVNTETDFLTYSFPEETGAATIDATAHTIDIEVGNGTDLTTLVADFTLSTGATADIGGTAQVSGTTANDFSLGAVNYNVTAQDGTTMQVWSVTVTEASINTETDFLTYSFPEETGAATIDATAHTIDIEIDWTADLANLTADFTLSYGANADIAGTAQVSGTTVNDFTNPVTYTITAEDATTTQDWTITVTQAVAPQGAMCSNPLPLTLPVVNETGTTEGFGDIYDNSMACNSNYMGGDDIVYEFTIAEDGFLNGEMTSPNSWIGLFILDGCPDAGANCIVSATNSGSSVSFNSQPIAAGTYFLIISSWPSPQFIEFDFSLSFVPATEMEIASYMLPGQNSADIVGTNDSIMVIMPAGTTYPITLAADFVLATGATADVGGTAQVSGTTDNTWNDNVTPVVYRVTGQDGVTYRDWSVYVDVALGVNGIVNSDEVSVYPNPSNGLFNVTLNLASAKDATVEVVNALGQVVATFENVQSNKTIVMDLSDRNAGLYFVRISSENNTLVKKVNIIK